jgi:hypothetical protein
MRWRWARTPASPDRPHTQQLITRWRDGRHGLGRATTRSSYGCANACGRTAGNRAAASRTRTVLSTTQAIAPQTRSGEPVGRRDHTVRTVREPHPGQGPAQRGVLLGPSMRWLQTGQTRPERRRAASAVCGGSRLTCEDDPAGPADARRWAALPLGPGGGLGKGCLLETISRTHETSLSSPARSTATKTPAKPTTTTLITGFPFAATAIVAVSAMLAPVPAAVPR